MRRNRSREPLFENLTIESAGAQGKSIAKHEHGGIRYRCCTGRCGGCARDQEEQLREAITTRFVASLLIVFRPSASTSVPCRCKWQDLAYPKQLEYKQQQVIDNLERLGGLVLPAVTPIMASPDVRYYRNKLEYTFSNKRWFTTDE